MNKFKKGDKIRIKDEVSNLTHSVQFPHFTETMDRMKDKVFTIRGFTGIGCIEVQESGFNLHPDWVELVKEFKTGDKIRIKDEVSHLTHRGQFPHFMVAMDGLKDKVLTIRDITSRGCIKVEESGYNLHPDWVEPIKRTPDFSIKNLSKDVSFDAFLDSSDPIRRELDEVSLDDFIDSILEYNSTPASEVDSILEEAQEILEGDRESDYGDPVDNFGRIADIASSILNDIISPEQCVVVMMAVKLSREQYKHKRDNLVDLVAYTEILNRVRELNK